MTHLEKIKIADRIKKHIHNEKNGYCGILWATKQVMGDSYETKSYETNSIASIITQTGKYKKEKVDHNKIYDYNITLNSDSNWFKRNPIKTEIFRFVLTVASAVLISNLTQKDESNKEQEPHHPNRIESESNVSPKVELNGLKSE